MSRTASAASGVTLRPLEAADVPRLAEIAAEPEVARWWLGLTEEDLLEKAGADEDGFVFAVELDGELIGLAQAGEEPIPTTATRASTSSSPPPGTRRASGPTRCARSRGGSSRTAATIASRSTPRSPTSGRSARYERVGFRRVGVMRRYERGADGDWHDGLLLDLLPEDLR